MLFEPIPAYGGSLCDHDRRVQEKTARGDHRVDAKTTARILQKAEAQIGPPCVSLVSKILVPVGHPPEEILNAANEEGCDVIVLGTHGKGFLAHTFLGSVSNAVLHRTRKPVFIIPLPSEKVSVDWDGI